MTCQERSMRDLMPTETNTTVKSSIESRQKFSRWTSPCTQLSKVSKILLSEKLCKFLFRRFKERWLSMPKLGAVSVKEYLKLPVLLIETFTCLEKLPISFQKLIIPSVLSMLKALHVLLDNTSKWNSDQTFRGTQLLLFHHLLLMVLVKDSLL